MRENLRRGVVVLAAVCVTLAAVAVPAGAATSTADLSSGTLVLSRSGATTLNIPMAGGSGAGCISGASTVDTVSTTSSTTGTVIVTTVTIATRVLVGTTWYVLESVQTSNTSSGSNYHTAAATGSSVVISIKFWTATDQTSTGTSCGHGTAPGDLKANWNATVPNIGVSITPTGGGSICDPAVSDTLSLNSTASTPLIGTSSPPFTSYILGNATLVGWLYHVTS